MTTSKSSIADRNYAKKLIIAGYAFRIGTNIKKIFMATYNSGVKSSKIIAKLYGIFALALWVHPSAI
ncbi:hypothetical protein DSUL_60124 [Desulfovibrionales bacterium]